MKSEGVHAFATFRITGDELVPDQITRILRLFPTQSFAKDELYDAGPRSKGLRGKTGTWFLSTDRIVASPKLSAHLNYLMLMLVLGPHPVSPFPAAGTPSHLVQLSELIERRSLSANVSCFWHGQSDSKPPTVPRYLLGLLKRLPATLDMDFFQDESEQPERSVG